MTLPPGIPAPIEWRLTVAAPPAGSDWSYTIPPGTWLRLVSGFATLTTCAAAANRYPGTLVKDATGVEIGELESRAISASLTQKLVYAMSHNWQIGGGVASEHTTLILSLPYFVLPPGYAVGSITVNLQVGDQYSRIDLLFERWASQPYFDAWTPSLRVR